MASVAPAAKKQKREWIKEFKGIGKSSKGINQINIEKLIYKVNKHGIQE